MQQRASDAMKPPRPPELQLPVATGERPAAHCARTVSRFLQTPSRRSCAFVNPSEALMSEISRAAKACCLQLTQCSERNIGSVVRLSRWLDLREARNASILRERESGDPYPVHTQAHDEPLPVTEPCFTPKRPKESVSYCPSHGRAPSAAEPPLRRTVSAATERVVNQRCGGWYRIPMHDPRLPRRAQEASTSFATALAPSATVRKRSPCSSRPTRRRAAPTTLEG